MGLETGSYIDALTITNPLGTDGKSAGDDHLRLIKKVVKATFPGMGGAAWRVQGKSSTYTVLATDNMSIMNCTDAITLNLTAAATLGNQHMFVAFANGGIVTIDGNSAETINGTATLVIPDGSAAMVMCDGSNSHAITFDTGASFRNSGFRKGGDIASASPLVIDSDGNMFDVTGTTGFSAMTVPANTLFILQFDGVLTMTHGAGTLDLPGSANITTAAGDSALCYSTAANVVRVISFTGSRALSDDSVTTAKIADDAVTLAKLASGTDGELITWDSSGDPAAVAVGTATYVLTSNGAGAAPTFQSAAGGSRTFISDTVVSAASTATITGLDYSTYRSYEIHFRDFTVATDSTELSIQIGDSGGLSTALYSYHSTKMLASGTGYSAIVAHTTDNWWLTDAVGSATGEAWNWQGTLFLGNGTNYPMLIGHGVRNDASAYARNDMTSGVLLEASHVTTRFCLFQRSGTNISGNITVFGINNA